MRKVAALKADRQIEEQVQLMFLDAKGDEVAVFYLRAGERRPDLPPGVDGTATSSGYTVTSGEARPTLANHRTTHAEADAPHRPRRLPRPAVGHVPEVVAAFHPTARGLLHCEMAAFRAAAERAMDDGRLWYAEQCFRFIERVYRAATPAVRNAIDISILEDLALGEFTENRYHALKDRMPRSLREKLVAVNDRRK